MPTKQELDRCYMKVALAHAALSKAKRKQVGCCLVTSTGIIVPGVNGMASGADNTCEIMQDEQLVSKSEVIHAELNSILKSAKQGVSVQDCKVYVTLSPCTSCAEMLVQVGVQEVVYLEEYRCRKGIDRLQQAGIICRQFQLN